MPPVVSELNMLKVVPAPASGCAGAVFDGSAR